MDTNQAAILIETVQRTDVSVRYLVCVAFLGFGVMLFGAFQRGRKS